MRASARAVPAAPGAPAPAPAAPALAWHYVDEPRTHEVRLELLQGEPSYILVRENAPGETDPDARLEDRVPLREPWAARLRHWELECQLSMLGRYWRNQVGRPGWSLVGRPAGAPVLDLRGSEPLRRGDGSVVHHLHQGPGERDRILAALRLPSDVAASYQIVSAEIDLGMAEAREIVVLHARLPEGPSRSRLVRGVMDLAARGYRALVTGEDYATAHGAAGARQAAAAWEDALGRIRAGELGEAAPVEREQAATLSEFLHVLNDPRLHALHRRFLTPAEEEALVASNGPAIRRAVAQRRARATHQEQHLLTILEASLLARERIRHKRFRCTDPEVAALRRLAFYL